jgi:hypothetical protein
MSYKNQSGRGAGTEPILLEVPAECKDLVGPIQDMITAMRTAQQSGHGTRAVDYASVEATVGAHAAAIERAAHAGILQTLEVDAPKLVIGGETYSRIDHALGTYRTMAGAVQFARAIFRQDGFRNAPIVDAISLRTGAVGRGWLPRTAQAMAHLVQAGPSREAKETAEQMGRLPYSRTSFERVTHEIGEDWRCHHAEIEDAIIEEFEVPAESASISVGLDRVSVPMEEPQAKPVGRPRKNAPKRPVERNYRMAYCGTVTIHDAAGEALRTFRFGCMPQNDPALLCEDMAAHAYHLREKRPDLKIKLLADGAPEMWNLLEDAFSPEFFGPVDRGVDFWHLIEKLSPAAKLLCGGDDGEAHLKRKAWRAALRRSSGAAAKILAELQDSGLEDTWYNGSQPVHEAITYLDNNLERMDYAGALRRKLPIGSGNVEATCKTLFAVRMKRAGSRWKTDTGEHIVRLRAVALSDHWDVAMARLHAERRVAVRRAG